MSNTKLVYIPIPQEVTEEWVRSGMENGLSYFIYAPEGHDGPSPPVIESITVNQRRGTIEISASGYDSVRWISEGNVVYEGYKVDLDDLPEPGPGAYIRAKVYGPGETVAGTQPFGIKTR